VIDLTNVTVKYGDNVIYKDFTFHFDEGVNVVLGRSGCGKTTLLNVVADLVEYSGVCATNNDAAAVFQTAALAPVSVWKNVDLVLPKGGNAQDVDSALTAVGLSDKRNQLACKLSGGEKQRLSLAMALASGRSVWLMDEPFSNLDYGTKVQLRATLDNLLQVSPKTVLFVTHDIDDALALADKIYLLKDRPATLTQVVEIQTPRNVRTDADEQILRIKAQLQGLLK